MRRRLLLSVAFAFGLLLLVLAAALHQVTRPLPPMPEDRDVFGFEQTARERGPGDPLPGIERYPARDGEQLAYRFYDSAAERVLVFVHGSSYHSAGYDTLARAVSEAGLAKVYLPNLRGHHLSGQRRGDVDYIGQLEDDLADLVSFIRGRGQRGSVILGGHSSGGGLVIRFAGGEHGELASAYLLLSPVIPVAPTTKGGDAGGWAQIHRSRLFGLLALNALGITGLNGLPIIQFNKPEAYRDGTETLAYSYRLNTSYHPRYEYASDIEALGDRVLLLIGDDDEANDAAAYEPLFRESGATAEIVRLPGVDHFGVFTDPRALDVALDWIRELP